MNPAEHDLPDETLQSLESSIQSTLPYDYRAFLKRFNLSRISENIVEADSMKFNISYFFGISEDKNFDIKNQILMYEHRIPSNMIPIALAGGGNLVLMTLPEGHIFYWDHESEGNEPSEDVGLHFLADSFTNFFSRIEPYVLQNDLTDVKIESVKLKPDFAKKFKGYLS